MEIISLCGMDGLLIITNLKRERLFSGSQNEHGAPEWSAVQPDTSRRQWIGGQEYSRRLSQTGSGHP